MVLSAGTSNTDALASTGTPLLSSFLELFHGHFDNVAQVQNERRTGLTPREGGGHEHIHCSLQRVELGEGVGPEGSTHVLASYYFDGRPERVFRQRLYRLEELRRDPQFGACVRMQIYRLRPEVSEALQAMEGRAELVAWGADDAAPSLHLPTADVFWRWLGERFEGSMRTESITLTSERTGEPLVVRDDVALWGDALWVNDRGDDIDGNYVYGHIDGVPYKMARVRSDHWTSTGRVLEVLGGGGLVG